MARSDKVPFRREFNVTTNGMITTEPLFVGDIVALFIELEKSDTSYLLKGRVGRDGDWDTLASGVGVFKVTDIDIRAYEYIELEVSNVTSSRKITLFGYEDQMMPDVTEVNLSYEDKKAFRNIICKLHDLEYQLKIMNTHLSLITDEEIDEPNDS